jgi:D-3-phosphoglycerate dehydrogenase
VTAPTSRLAAPIPIVVSEPDGLIEATTAQLRRLGPVTLGPFSRADLLKNINSAGVLMVRLGHMIDAEVLQAAPHLKAIVSATTGLNHIDLGICKARGIEIISIRGERAFLSTITGTAELALALLLNLARHVIPACRDVQSGRWKRDDFRGMSLRDLTLGIIGVGRLGCLMAGYGHALGMRVLGVDPQPVGVPAFVQMATLESMLAEADAISLHASHNAGEPPILDRKAVAVMKPGVLLVNTARGELVDEGAVLENLQRGRLGGYAADVVSNELTWKDLRDHPLVRYAADHQNVIVTPHIGGATVDSLVRAEAFVVGKLLRHFGLQTVAAAQ